MPQIDPSSRVDPKAELAGDVVIGPFTSVGPHVRIGAGTVVQGHCAITGRTEIGRNNKIFPFATIGTPPQDLSFRGEPTRLVIGDANTVRECVTINCGTMKGGGVTIVGNQNLIMACAHVAHDCLLGDRIVMANCVLLAGHVKVEDGVIFSGSVGVHHFVTLGAMCMVGGLTAVTRDVPPYMMVQGDDIPRTVNIIGLKRNGFSDHDVESVQRAFRLLYRSKTARADVPKKLEELGMLTPAAKNVLEAVRRAETGKLGRYLEATRQEAPRA